jgi:flagellar hook-length control protein FliK
MRSNEGNTAKESAGSLSGENGSTDQTVTVEKDQDKTAAPQALESLPTKSVAKKYAAEPVSLEKLSLDNSSSVDKNATTDKKSYYPATQAVSASDSQPVSVVSPIKAENGKKQSGTGAIDVDAEKTDYASLVKNESSAALLQAGNAPGEKGPGITEESQHVRVHAENPAENTENSISILKDGDRLAVKLEPDGLGKININLSLDNGKIHAQINVQDSTTKNLIENNMQGIVDALVKEGLTVGGFSVSLNNGGAGKQIVDNFWKNTGKGSGTSLPAINAAITTAAMGRVDIYA